MASSQGFPPCVLISCKECPDPDKAVVALCRTTKEGVYLYAQTPRSKWIEKCLGMVTLSGSAIWWTWETEDVFRRVRGGNKYAMKVCSTV